MKKRRKKSSKLCKIPSLLHYQYSYTYLECISGPSGPLQTSKCCTNTPSQHSLEEAPGFSQSKLCFTPLFHPIFYCLPPIDFPPFHKNLPFFLPFHIITFIIIAKQSPYFSNPPSSFFLPFLSFPSII